MYIMQVSRTLVQSTQDLRFALSAALFIFIRDAVESSTHRTVSACSVAFASASNASDGDPFSLNIDGCHDVPILQQISWARVWESCQ